jgi:hypothetical protein
MHAFRKCLSLCSNFYSSKLKNVLRLTSQLGHELEGTRVVRGLIEVLPKRPGEGGEEVAVLADALLDALMRCRLVAESRK